MMEKKYTCPKCGNPDCEEGHLFCWNCGTALGNCCENPDCYAAGMTDSENGSIDLPDSYRHCPYCGELTRYGKAGYRKEIEFPL